MSTAIMSVQRSVRHRPVAALRACTALRHRGWTLVIYAFLMVAVAALGVFGPGEGTASRIQGLAFFAVMANFAIWSGWFARLFLLQSQAGSLRMPGVSTAVGQALLLAATVTLLVPGSLLSALGVPPATAFGAAALGLFAGLLFALMPWPAAMGLLMLPGAAKLLPSDVPIGVPLAGAAVIAGLIVLVASVRAVLRTSDPTAIPAWRRPVILQAPGGMVAWGDPKIAAAPDAPAVHQGWLVAMPRPERAGPHAPRAAIDTLLAGPMGYLARSAVLKQWGLLVLGVVVLLLIPFRGDTPLVRDALLTGALVGLFAGGWTLALRLERQRRRVSGELAELALLPGLGTPSETCARLVRNVVVRLAQLMLFALAGLMLLAWIRGTAWPHVALLLGVLAGAGASGLLMCAAALTGSGVSNVRMFFIMLPLLVAGTASMMVALIPLPVASHPAVWVAGWIMLTGAYLAAAFVRLQRFRARPHAFLLD